MRLMRRVVRAFGRALLSAADRERVAQLAYRDEGHGYDLFGLHPDWVMTALGLSAPWYRHYFRVTAHGAEHIPQTGPAIVVANHAGTLPIDAVMLCLDIVEHTEPPRLPRTVVDHFVPMLPFVGTALSRVGAINGTMPNARYLLQAGDLCLTFPEGLPAIGKPWEERYRLSPWRPGHAELALRCHVPVVPVAIIGSEEQWPQLGRINARGVLGIPYVPIVATPLPLPVHYHIHYGAPLTLGSDRSDDSPSTEEIESAAAKTRDAVQTLLDQGLAARQGVFR